MSGTKVIRNTTPYTLNVTVIGRTGNDPTQNGRPVGPVPVEPGQSHTFQYGDDQNPYMNALEINSASATAGISSAANMRATARGGPGTVDAFFNTNSTITVGWNASSFSFPLTASN